MSISIYIEPITNGKELIRHLLTDEFKINEANAELLYEHIIKKHFESMKDDIYILAETNYVDKVYRNSYYNYYSSKNTHYKRDCVRLSFFEGEIFDEEFREEKAVDKLQKQYRGFIVLRPTEPSIVGRSIISPLALKNNGFQCCVSKFHTTANGRKFTVKGFPHSSQDSETISCAETSLWALMEYFSNKYSDYRPVLPSKIINTLAKVTSERQVPSKGLNINQLSFALKEYGFGTRIYSRGAYKDDFERLLSCYIESDIPIIVAMQNTHLGGSIGHALLTIGHEVLDKDMIDNIPELKTTNATLNAEISMKSVKIFDYDEIKKDFVFIDDNHPIYQRAKIQNPAVHYGGNWRNCEVTYFVVPLYPKIYLEAFEAKNYILNLLIKGPECISDKSEILIRTYLASSRSFKDKIAINPTIQSDLKSLILESSMPKFIWVCEVSSKELIKDKRAIGLIALDATEANISFNKPLLFGAYSDKYVHLDKKTGKLASSSLPLQSFSIYDHNLNTFN